MFKTIISRSTNYTSTLYRAQGRRLYSSASSEGSAVSEPAKRKTFAGIRGGLMGFFLGATLAGGYGFFYLVEQYQAASALVLSSVNELEKTATTIQTYVRKIDAVESQLEALQKSTVSRNEHEKLVLETRKLADTFTKDYLQVKAHLLKLEQDR
ncbi:hypothetical protein AYI68_g3854 [Smittium mucronatum]|uniref:Uncharacterized protein n=1 Tax=Smittium mucronatum TaxID=133383 RepID=A0A1R0GYQ5_9FUNG|nr:hypothetical protein AYI68_g3854 [Smittium mucronatum]